MSCIPYFCLFSGFLPFHLAFEIRSMDNMLTKIIFLFDAPILLVCWSQDDHLIGVNILITMPTWSQTACTLGYNKFNFYRKWRIQTLWWVQKWNLRFNYKICFLIFWAFFARLAYKSDNMTRIFFFKYRKRYQKTQNFLLIFNP